MTKAYSPNNLPPGFQRWYSAYPKKVGKGAALKAWLKNDCEGNADEIVAATRRYQFSDDKQYIPHPSTWINQWRWLDEQTEGDNDEW